MKVISYHAGIPPKNKNSEKSDLLTKYITGVTKKGDIGINHYGSNLLDCDVAIIQGFIHENSKNVPHLNLRKNIFKKQQHVNKKTLIVDSNLFLYLNKSNQPFHYLRYSFDGVFRNTGFYFDKDVDPVRWKKLSTNLNIKVKEYRQSGNHILICLQRNGGWSMKGQDVITFCKTTINEIKKFTDRPIIVRGHPGDKKTKTYLNFNIPNVTFSRNDNLQDDLKNAWATVLYNSSPGVASLIEGIPVFQMDKSLGSSMYGEVANSTLKRLEDPKLFDRQDWLNRLAMCHWNFSELESGEAWSFMKNYV